MARIEEKSKQKSKKALGKKIWNGIVVFVLASVVIGGLIFGGILLFGKDDEEEEPEVEYDELFPSAELITFDDLDSIFDVHTPNQDLLVDGVIYVFVYSPEYVANLEEGSKEYNYYQTISASVNAAVEYFGEAYEGSDAFYVINTLSDENKDLTANGANLSEYNKSGEDLTTLTAPYLLVISRGDSNDFEIPLNGVKENREISSVLNRVTNE